MGYKDVFQGFATHLKIEHPHRRKRKTRWSGYPATRIQRPISLWRKEIYSVKVLIWYFSASFRRRQAKNTQLTTTPRKQPKAVPHFHKARGIGSSRQTQQSPGRFSVLRSERAATQPGSLRSAMAKSLAVFTLRPW